MVGKRVEIVFQETNGPGFQVFLQGMDKKRREEVGKMTVEEQMEKLSPAEFWALRCFQITMHALKSSGVVTTAVKRGPDV